MDAHHYECALATGKRAAELAGKLLALPMQSELDDIIGRAYQGLGRFDEAQKAFQKSISEVEELQLLVAGDAEQQEGFLEKRNLPYKNMVGLLVTAKRSSEAFQFAEREKARVLLNMMGRDRVNVSKELSSAEQDRERQLQTQISWLNTEI